MIDKVHLPNIDPGLAYLLDQIQQAIIDQKHGYGARAYLNSAQNNLVDDTLTKVLLDGETFDVQGEFASYKYTATTAGYYIVVAQVTFSSSVIADKLYESFIRKNGTTVSNGYAHSAFTDALSAPVSDIVHLDVGDYLELWAVSRSGDNTVDLATGNANTFMSVMRMLEYF